METVREGRGKWICWIEGGRLDKGERKEVKSLKKDFVGKTCR